MIKKSCPECFSLKMYCPDCSKINTINDEANEFVIKEFSKLETAILKYMNTMKKTADMSDKEVMRITKADSNYFIKEWEKRK